MAADKLRQDLELAVSAHQAGRLKDAEDIYRRILRLRPKQFDALHLLGMIDFARGDLGSAERRLSDAIAVNAASPPALSNRSAVRLAQGNAEAALKDADRAIALDANFAAAHVNRANALLPLGKSDLALAAYERALALDPRNALAWSSRAVALLRFKRSDEALASAQRAIALAPGLADGWANAGLAYQEMGDPSQAQAHYERALAIDPQHPDALYNRGILKHSRGEFSSSLEDLEAAVKRKRFDGDAGQILHTRMNSCAWEGTAEARSELEARIMAGALVSVPFSVLTLFDNPRLSQISARLYTAGRFPSQDVRARKFESRGDKLRIAYLSADFGEHPTSYLLIDTLERHDRSKFHITAAQIGTMSSSAMGERILGVFDETLDLRKLSDEAAAQRLAEARIDILVDLMGHTHHSRPGVLARRPAPIQVNYLGYPGTMGASYMDYLIADAVVAPNAEYFDERLCLLPDTYQPTSRPNFELTPSSRSAEGLPEDAFVFCSFCNNWKITPEVFDSWMRLLAQVPNSVLWLLANNDDVRRNLRREAEQRGVSGDRILFARRVSNAEHLSRHGCADLLLDTFPYGAHTTASDAIAMGLPMVSRSGAAFYTRVARSVLKAADLEEFAVETVENYEALALALASDPARYRAARAKFKAAGASRLFDSARYARNLEWAFTEMARRAALGEEPGPIVVPG
jgi:predicted O-linked N-acetylglucosamine transferase (SPINDLY family)